MIAAPHVETVAFDDFPGRNLRAAVFGGAGAPLPDSVTARQGKDISLFTAYTVTSVSHLRLAAYTTLMRESAKKLRHREIHVEFLMLFSSSRGLAKGIEEVGFNVFTEAKAGDAGPSLVLVAWDMELEDFSAIVSSIPLESLPLTALDSELSSQRAKYLKQIHKIPEEELELVGGLKAAVLSRMASKDIM